MPELGEEVLVGFEGGNAEKPYIIGTHYNGKEKSGYADSDNKIKAIHTRSGHIVKFTEEESIIITDKSGNEIHLDTTGGNINITAPSSINITAGKSVNITAGEDISISAGMNISTSATMNYTQMVGINYISTIAGNASHFITGKLIEMIEGDVHSETKKGKTIYNSEGGLETSSLGTIFRFAEKEISHNSG